VCEILKALDNVRIIPSTFLVVGGRVSGKAPVFGAGIRRPPAPAKKIPMIP